MAGCPGEQTPLEAEAKQVIVGRGRRDLGSGPLSHEQLGQCPPNGRIVVGPTFDRAYLRRCIWAN
jgi:hypothetical protein